MRNFKIFTVLICLLCVLSMTMTSCSVASVNADEELVFVKKPIIFGKVAWIKNL